MRNIKLSRNAEMITQLCQGKNTPPPPLHWISRETNIEIIPFSEK